MQGEEKNYQSKIPQNELRHL